MNRSVALIASVHTYSHVPLQCQFLIVACDGVWDVMTDQEAIDVVSGCQLSRYAVSHTLCSVIIKLLDA